MGRPFVQAKSKKSSSLMLHCQHCFDPILERVAKRGKPKVNGCMQWGMPKEPKGRSTPKQRGQYFGWHLVAKPNMQMNNIPALQVSFFEKLFYGRISPSPFQAKRFVEMVSNEQGRNGKSPLVARIRISRMLKDTEIIRTQINNGSYNPQTKTLFEESVETFEKNLKALKRNLPKNNN